LAPQYINKVQQYLSLQNCLAKYATKGREKLGFLHCKKLQPHGAVLQAN
jgi:hypothetical protein